MAKGGEGVKEYVWELGVCRETTPFVVAVCDRSWGEFVSEGEGGVKYRHNNYKLNYEDDYMLIFMKIEVWMRRHEEYEKSYLLCRQCWTCMEDKLYPMNNG